MKDSETPEASSVIVEPISMSIFLARNLCPWFHDIPDIDVKGKLKAVQASGFVDYTVCCGQLSLHSFIRSFVHLTSSSIPSKSSYSIHSFFMSIHHSSSHSFYLFVSAITRLVSYYAS